MNTRPLVICLMRLSLVAWAITICQCCAQAPQHGALVFGSYGSDVFDAGWQRVLGTVGGVVLGPSLDERGYLYGVSVGNVIESPPTPAGWMGPWGGHPSLTVAGASLFFARAFPTRERVWVVEGGRLGWLSKGVSGQFVNWTRQIPMPSGSIVQADTDGRHLLYSTAVVVGAAAHVYLVELSQSGASAATPVIALPVDPNTERAPRAVCFGDDGRALLLDGAELIEIDLRTLSTRVVSAAAPLMLEAEMEYDPWIGKLKLASKVGWADIFEYDMATDVWRLQFTYPVFLGPISGGIAAIRARPFEVFGVGCANGAGATPRLGWAGLPRQGGSFSVDVRDTEPNAFVAFWLGMSDTFWSGVGNLPFDAGGLGAPGCTMYASAEDWYPALADPIGGASVSFSVPVDASLAGLEFHIQSASTSSANALGMAASDALVVRVR